MLNQNTKKNPEIEGALFNCAGEIGMDDIGCLNSSLSLCYFYFVTSLQKNYGVRRLPAEPPSFPYTSQYAFSWTTPSPSERTYFMDDPLINF